MNGLRDPIRTRTAPTRAVVLALVALVGLAVLSAPPAAADGECGAMDVAFAIDDTGSMGGAISNVAAEAAALLAQIQSASGGDYQLALLTFKDHVDVLHDLAPGNAAAVEASLLALGASGGGNLAEASDEALNTAINGLDAADRPLGAQIGDFDGMWRADAVKIIILITDAPPGGFDDLFDNLVDLPNAEARAAEADAADIAISAVFVPTAGDYSGQAAIMEHYATATDGVFVTTAADGSGTADAISSIVEACGGDNPPDCTLAAPSVTTLWPPNHRLHAVSVVGVVDDTPGPIAVLIESIFQDELVDAIGMGDGNTSPDGGGLGTDTALVRAERHGAGDGRVYTLGFSATDEGGNVCVGSVTVSVPHSNNGAAAVSQGALFDSTIG